MHRQATFYAANWPEGTDVSEDGDVFAFYLPATNDEFGDPVLGGGEFVTAFSDRARGAGVPDLPVHGPGPTRRPRPRRTAAGSRANKGLDVEQPGQPDRQALGETLQDPDAVFRFDGSDLMPAAVGAGSFWKEMTAWITGQSTQDDPRQHRGLLAQ